MEALFPRIITRLDEGVATAAIISFFLLVLIAIMKLQIGVGTASLLARRRMSLALQKLMDKTFRLTGCVLSADSAEVRRDPGTAHHGALASVGT